MRKLKLVKNDAGLQPYEEAINGRFKYYKKRLSDLIGNGTLSEFATGYM